MFFVRTLLSKMIHTWPVVLLLANWYGAHPLLVNFTDHDIAICIKYALTGAISLLFVLVVIQTKMYSNRILVNIPLVLGFGLALCQLYYMGWNIIQIPWPVFKPANIPQYLQMISRLKIPYLFCSIFPVLLTLKLFIVLNQKLPKTQLNTDEIDTHGSARFATPKEMQKLNCKQGIPIGIIPQQQSVSPPRKFVKSVQKQKDGEVLRLDPVHVLIIAPSRSGKDVGIVMPTLLDYEGPVLVTDVKSAENFYVTARYRRSKGRQVYAFDPFKITKEKSVAINILDYYDPDREEIVTDLSDLANLICPIPLTGTEKDIHFAELALSLIHCFLMYVICSDEIPNNKKNLKTIYEFFCQGRPLFQSLLEKIYANTTLCYGVPSRLAGSFLAIDPREWSGVYTTGSRQLKFTDSPLMDRVLNHSSIDLHDVINNKADLFVCIPTQSLRTQGRILKLLLTALFVFIRNQHRKTKVPLLMVLEELPIIGNITGLEDILIVGGGYGVKVMAIVQSIQLLKSIYPDSWETILGSNLSVFINPSDKSTKDHISDSIGQMTVETISSNKGESEQASTFLRSSVSENEGQSIQHISRAVLTPDEVGRLGKNIVLAFLQGERPLLLKRLSYFKDKAWKGKFDPNPLETQESEDVFWKKLMGQISFMLRLKPRKF